MNRPIPRGREAYRHFTIISMRWADNDAYGHVNNAIFYQWFDTSVNQWLIEQELLDIRSGDPIGLVVETGCTYFASLSYPGDIEVGMALERLGSSSVTYRLGVFAACADDPAAQGYFTHVYVGRDSRRPVALPDDWRAKLVALA